MRPQPALGSAPQELGMQLVSRGALASGISPLTPSGALPPGVSLPSPAVGVQLLLRSALRVQHLAGRGVASAPGQQLARQALHHRAFSLARAPAPA